MTTTMMMMMMMMMMMNHRIVKCTIFDKTTYSDC